MAISNIAPRAMSEDEFATLVNRLAADPIGSAQLTDLLREEHTVYDGRGTATVVRMRGWILLALARSGLSDKALIFVRRARFRYRLTSCRGRRALRLCAAGMALAPFVVRAPTRSDTTMNRCRSSYGSMPRHPPGQAQCRPAGSPGLAPARPGGSASRALARRAPSCQSTTRWIGPAGNPRPTDAVPSCGGLPEAAMPRSSAECFHGTSIEVRRCRIQTEAAEVRQVLQ